MDYKEIYFSSIDSTNTYLKKHFFELENFTIVRSDFQSSGHGREDRVWQSQKGQNLLFSILIKDKIIEKNRGFLSLVAAYSVCESIIKYVSNSLKPLIKWPNDIYVNDKKICGILLEGKLPEYIIIGIGINVNQNKFDGEYRKEPTSLYLETGNEISIDSFKEVIYKELIDNLSNCNLKKEIFLNYFKSHDYLLDKEVTYIENNITHSGVVRGVNEDFSLIIERDGVRHNIVSGEIDLIKVKS